MPRIYLDNAATSFPKTPGVYEAMLDYGTHLGASPGRGHYAESREGARLIRQCRQRINTLINGESADHVIFALNTTDALNLAIKGIARHRRLYGQPTNIVASAMDHNSVLRPLNALAGEGVTWTCIEADEQTGRLDPADIARALTPETALVIVNMCSNVSGTIQPAAEIGMICRAARVPLLIDAAQALGHIPVDARALNADLLAFPGHKGLMGPQGTGGLYIRPGIEKILATTREGGTGSQSEHDVQPDTLPEKYEAGSHNTIGIVGLSRAVEWILTETIDKLRTHELELITLMLTELHRAGARLQGREPIDGPLSTLRLLGPSDLTARVGVFSLVHDSIHPAEMAAMLEQLGILVRSGIHCAPRAHQTLGTLGEGAQGAFRLSVGPFTTADHIRAAIAALVEVCNATREPQSASSGERAKTSGQR
jgi:cysteine desulfurase family protein